MVPDDLLLQVTARIVDDLAVPVILKSLCRVGSNVDRKTRSQQKCHAENQPVPEIVPAEL